MKEKTFFQLKTGDVILMGSQIIKVKGRSLGRDWCAIRTSKCLHHFSKSKVFTVVTE
jgi:hypothetical protein